EAHRSNPEVAQDLDAHTVVALIGLESQALVRLDRVEAFVLQLVRANLVGKADPAAFLIQIQQHPASFGCDSPHRGVKLGAAIAADRMQDVAGETLRV